VGHVEQVLAGGADDITGVWIQNQDGVLLNDLAVGKGPVWIERSFVPFNRTSLENDRLVIAVDCHGRDLANLQVRGPVVHLDGVRDVLLDSFWHSSGRMKTLVTNDFIADGVHQRLEISQGKGSLL